VIERAAVTIHCSRAQRTPCASADFYLAGTCFTLVEDQKRLLVLVVMGAWLLVQVLFTFTVSMSACP
jgi:hypothetical protein